MEKSALGLIGSDLSGFSLEKGLLPLIFPIPKQVLQLVLWSIAVVYLMKAIFGEAWAVTVYVFMAFRPAKQWNLGKYTSILAVFLSLPVDRLKKSMLPFEQILRFIPCILPLQTLP